MDSLEKAPNLGLDNLEGLAEAAFFTGTGTEEVIPDVIREPSLPDPGVFEWADEEPVPVNLDDVRRLIGYPQMARDASIEGTVLLRVLVGKDGRYQRHLLVNSAHPLLTQAVEQEIDKLTFSPAIQGGNPIYFWVNVPFHFRLLR